MLLASVLVTSVFFIVLAEISRVLQGTLLVPPAGGTIPDYELLNLIQSTVWFVVDPVLTFFIFYAVGSRLRIDPVARYTSLLKYAFAGALIGFALYMFVLAELFGLTYGPETNSLAYLSNLALGAVRTSLSTTFLAFAGVLVGRLRSARKQNALSPVTSATQVAA